MRYRGFFRVGTSKCARGLDISLKKRYNINIGNKTEGGDYYASGIISKMASADL